MPKITDIARVSLSDQVRLFSDKVMRCQVAYDTLKDKSTTYANQILQVLIAYKEVLAVLTRHLSAAQQPLALDLAGVCGNCGFVHTASEYCTGNFHNPPSQ